MLFIFHGNLGWTTTTPSIKAERVNERLSPISVRPEQICSACTQLQLSEDCFIPTILQERSVCNPRYKDKMSFSIFSVFLSKNNLSTGEKPLQPFWLEGSLQI